MKENLPVIYLSVLIVLLSAIAVFVFREILKTRTREKKYTNLQKKLKEQKGTAQEYYELGSIYLEKKLFVQAINVLQKALKTDDALEAENKALIWNAIGFAYFAQEQYELAIRNYKEALKLYPTYTIALNNLGNVYERKQMTLQALEIYQQTLEYEPGDKVAKVRCEALQKRVNQ